MMKTLSLALFALFFLLRPILATEPSPGGKSLTAIVGDLETQSTKLAAALQAHDVHSLHEIDHAVAQEMAELQSAALGLPVDRQQKVSAVCADLARQASRVHHDGHRKDWDDALKAQKLFASEVQQLKSLAGQGEAFSP